MARESVGRFLEELTGLGCGCGILSWVTTCGAFGDAREPEKRVGEDGGAMRKEEAERKIDQPCRCLLLFPPRALLLLFFSSLSFFCFSFTLASFSFFFFFSLREGPLRGRADEYLQRESRCSFPAFE
jgi:hypothetical protein